MFNGVAAAPVSKLTPYINGNCAVDVTENRQTYLSTYFVGGDATAVTIGVG